MIFAFRLTASWLGHMPVLCLCSLALLAYGGRAAAVMAGVAIVMLMITDMVASLARGTMPVHRLLFFLAFMLAGPLALSAALGTTNLGARITDRFFLDQSAQSRFESRLPNTTSSCKPSVIRATALVTLRVTNSIPRRGPSWLNKMPEHAYSP